MARRKREERRFPEMGDGQGGQWWVPTCVGPLGRSDSWEETVQ